jgi:hypothetical protein
MKMEDPTLLTPALQLDDPEVARRAQAYLQDHGYRAEIRGFEDLPADQRPPWIHAERGGWLLYLESARFQEAMQLLEALFSGGEEPG